MMEEVPVRAPGIHVSLIINRRHRSARIVDFLSGNFPQKVVAIDALARREGIERVFTFVEREESLGWARVGFVREGSIPGYYKRSDAHIMGRLVSSAPEPSEDGVALGPLANQSAAERTLTQAKKLCPDICAEPRGLKVSLYSDESVVAASVLPPRSKKGGAWFDERFGRTGERLHVGARLARPGARAAEQLLSLELQEPFGNAYLQLTSWAQRQEDGLALFCALQAVTEPLRAREIGCVFGLSPADCVVTSAAFLAAGYKRTGLLAQHLRLGDRRVDALLWSRRNVGADADAA
ncbi:MAG: hypothetical protein R3A48_18355 [Polyangiales bacterium]